MKILYVNRGASPSKFSEYLKKYNNKLQQQGQKYNQLLMEGLVQNGAEVVSLSTRPINRSITKQKYFKGEKETENGIMYRYIPFLNAKLLREFSVFFGIFFNIFFTHEKKKDAVVVCDALNIAAAFATVFASSLRGFKTVSIVTDVPEHLASTRKVTLNQKINLFIMRKFKSYLLLTEQMNEIVNPKKKPYVVLEGHVDFNMNKIENVFENKDTKKVCLYAGSLRSIYGIGNLVNGFLGANIPEAELHVYGDGDYRDLLEEISKKNSSVKYFGMVSNAEIVSAELKATLLVNPRPTNEEYTKYSFPSKNMEYMASGTPVLTTRLPGMPEDHLPHVFLIEDESPEGIKNALLGVFEHSDEELHSFGADAKRFVLEKKNNRVQAKKLLEMLK